MVISTKPNIKLIPLVDTQTPYFIFPAIGINNMADARKFEVGATFTPLISEPKMLCGNITRQVATVFILPIPCIFLQ